MKKIIYTTIILGLLYSCTGVNYKVPQPHGGKNLDEFPEKMRGTFEVKLMDEEKNSGADTMIIFSNYYLDGKNDIKKVYLSDSTIIREFKGNYYFSGKAYNEEHWTVAQIVIESNDKFMINGVYDTDDDEDLFVENVNNITAITVVKNKNGGTDYVINPTPKELEKLSKNNFFKPVYEFTRISE